MATGKTRRYDLKRRMTSKFLHQNFKPNGEKELHLNIVLVTRKKMLTVPRSFGGFVSFIRKANIGAGLFRPFANTRLLGGGQQWASKNFRDNTPNIVIMP